MRTLETSPRKLVGSVQRAVDILDLFGEGCPELGTTEIAQALGLHKSTVSTLVATLAANGYLEQNSATRKYLLGLKILERSAVLLARMDIRRVAHPFLDQLRDWRGESVNMGIRDGDVVVYIDQLPGTHATALREEVGKRAPLHSTALGKALIAWLPATELQAIIADYDLTPRTPRTIVSQSDFLEELEKTRERGYAMDDEEHEAGGRCIGAPVFDRGGRPVAAVSQSAPLPRVPLDQVPVVAEMVRNTAKAISLRLGYVQRPY